MLSGQQTGDAGALLCLPCIPWPVAICDDLPLPLALVSLDAIVAHRASESL